MTNCHQRSPDLSNAEHLDGAHCECATGLDDPTDGFEVVAGCGCCEIQLVLDRDDIRVRVQQRQGGKLTSAVGDGASGAGMNVAVLLGDLGPARQHDVDTSGCDEAEFCAKVPHQRLAFETVPDAGLHIRRCGFEPSYVCHGAPQFRPVANRPQGRLARDVLTDGRHTDETAHCVGGQQGGTLLIDQGCIHLQHAANLLP